jgi:hypothetical protein
MHCGEAEMSQQNSGGDCYQKYKAYKELYFRKCDKVMLSNCFDHLTSVANIY